MKKYFKIILCGSILSILLSGLVSCTDYLDRDEESIINGEDAYKNFLNFQGFTEELYYCIPLFHNHYWQSSFNWGEDELIVAGATWFFGYKVDQGDFWGWMKEYDGWGCNWMDGTGTTTNDDRMQKRMWPLVWYGIRKANMGLENLNKLQDATQEEKDLIEGQLLFFRGWFHFMLMQYFGGLPYVDHVLSADNDEDINLPRLNYQQTADRAAEDFRKAADLLPIDWDNTTVGKNTLGKNRQRINKIMALGYLGKNYLWAGSPLMNNESTGNKSYNADYCKKAAEAFAEMLNLCTEEGGAADYSLMPFNKYSDIFYTINQGMKIPGYPEVIFQAPSYDAGGTRWYMNLQYSPGVLFDGSSNCFSPTANYVNYYGMKNGLPIPDATKVDAESGYDPQYPWRDRDPRFYHDIVYDGVKCIQGATQTRKEHRYANLYTSGSYRDEYQGSRTGYLMYKFIPNNVNNDDYGQDKSHVISLSYMRLADVYLMYAEAAANGYGSPSGKTEGFSKSAVDAINHVRERAGVDPVADKYLVSTDAFMSEVRRERAVELAYEGHRFNDLRRWLLLTEYPYTLKTAHDFERAAEFNPDDPQHNRVLNLKERVVLERKLGTKHYWLPLKRLDVHMYLEFDQNPGW